MGLHGRECMGLGIAGHYRSSTFGSPVFVSFFLVEDFPFSWFSQEISHYFEVVVGKGFEDLLILLLNFSLKVKFSLSAAEFVFFQRRLSHSSHSFRYLA
jgi:hypothetical protein